MVQERGQPALERMAALEPPQCLRAGKASYTGSVQLLQ
jgi:hypothetical protein